jgi:hypothetical protein
LIFDIKDAKTKEEVINIIFNIDELITNFLVEKININ